MGRENVRNVREANIRVVLNYIRRFAPTSRSQISKFTQLSPSTISSLVDQLIAAGLVKETTAPTYRGGRKPIKLYLNDKDFFSLGIEIETYYLFGLVINLVGEVIRQQRVPISPYMGYSLILEKIVQLYHELSQGLPKDGIMGLGIASPGYVDGLHGRVIYSANLNWRDVPVLEIINQGLDVPVFVLSNISAVALGELWFGAGEGHSNIICVRVGSGIGAGLILNGELYEGPQHRAGHFGHVVVERRGKPCRCGSFGCLETYVSTTQLIQRVAEGLRTGALTEVEFPSQERDECLNAIIAAGQRGDRFVLNIFEEMGEYLGLGISSLTNVFNPELVILAGGMAKAGDLILQPVRRTVSLHAFPPVPEITLSKLGANTVAIGAATKVIEEVFDNPSKITQATRNPPRVATNGTKGELAPLT